MKNCKSSRGFGDIYIYIYYELKGVLVKVQSLLKKLYNSIVVAKIACVYYFFQNKLFDFYAPKLNLLVLNNFTIFALNLGNLITQYHIAIILQIISLKVYRCLDFTL